MDNNSEDKDKFNQKTTTQTQSGQTSTTPSRLTKEIDTSMVEECMAIGAGIGCEFDHTCEICLMKHKEAMATPKAKQWGEAVDVEHDRLVNHVVFKALKKSNVPKFAKIQTTQRAI